MDNPFVAVRIGSTVDMFGQFRGSVLSSNAHITKLDTLYTLRKFMGGQSDLIYTHCCPVKC
jgi:hypothetical protein